MWSQTWISYSSAWYLLFILKTSVLKARVHSQTPDWPTGLRWRGLWESEAAELMIGPQTQGLLEREGWHSQIQPTAAAKKPGSTVIFSVCLFQREKVNVNMCVKVCVCASRLASSELAAVFHNGTEAGGRWGIDWLNPHIATPNQQTPLRTSLPCNDLPFFWLILHLITLNLYLMSSLQNKCTETQGITECAGLYQCKITYNTIVTHA